ncbi:hypothetical protein BAUCODRAFT_356979 [Baudoinia panamericana UAMH 10762]|uniref:mRNA 3'-end-processing protein RNA14 n=1 Tax=Baudoinia panamericana (strain UAMH 10762) TaxID=717646 RepID=M2MSW2_BAUPA|nr:uncharacterized protein BAUCODRAFT_356979 [Baudoinia panamericana UAMH 10762]EMC99961.1 hypothetical protein BAUCODRAFT_356979 [Baudoinia panamericana UAMH 10762]
MPQSTLQQRLPHDKVGRLEDRIRDDPRADTEAWWELVQHYKDKDQLDNARNVYVRMLEVWPTSPAVYLSYLDLEYSDFDRNHIDQLFSASLPVIPSLPLWTSYLSYLRRVFPLVPDPQGDNRKIITQAFEAVLDTVGIDPDSGNLWRDYIDFIKSGPGMLGATGWQDMQKMDQLRKAYQRAIKVPTEDLIKLWKEYDNFEITYNKATSRKVLQEQSPHYMTARTAEKQLRSIVDGLQRDGGGGAKLLPTLPPLEGCEGDDAFAEQVMKWRAWIEWEKSDQLVLKDEEISLWRKRIVYAYKQATINLRFYPKIWFEAAQWCFEQLGVEDMATHGEKFLDDGLMANAESVLLTLKKTDHLEQTMPTDGGDEQIIKNGERLDAVFESCVKCLYDLNKKHTERKDRTIAEAKEHFASLPPDEADDQQAVARDEDDDERHGDESPVEKPKTRAEQLQERINAIQSAARIQNEIMKKTISYVWIAKMRSFRRVQGQGKPQAPKKGFRGVFAEARPRGQLAADVYVASALTEWHCYKDPSALKIFERGLKLFPTDEGFAIEYMRHLLFAGQGDVVNARVVFETTVTKITNGKGITEQEKKAKIRPLINYMHEYESQYGDLAAMKKLEARMKDLYPDEPEVSRFAMRFDMPGKFDGMSVQLILSPAQAKPKTTFGAAQQNVPMLAVHGIAGEEAMLRLGRNGPYMASPKRPLEDDTDADTPRKFMRAESPLKGAAGRRVQGHVPTGSTSNPVTSTGTGGTITVNSGGNSGYMTKSYVPATSPAYNAAASAPGNPTAPPAQSQFPGEINYLLSILPPAHSYNVTVFLPEKVLELLRYTNLNRLVR